jgi:predicted transposase/invertase (TIGR01784 family)
MRRDSIFYKLFQQFPSLLFELLANPPANPENYRFDSVAVKEPTFEIDGVFLPAENDPAKVVYFCETQFQKDERLYERLIAESSLYFYRNCELYNDWQAVVIYPSRSFEQSNIHPHRSLLNGGQLHRVYLDELGEIRELPLNLALMALTTVKEEQAPELARYLIDRSRQEQPQPDTKVIIEMATTILTYKFTQLNLAEVRTMLGITLEETTVYKEIKQEGRLEGIADFVIRLLTKRLGQEPSEEIRARISNMPLSTVESLGEALFDFTNLADLQAWLERNN